MKKKSSSKTKRSSTTTTTSKSTSMMTPEQVVKEMSFVRESQDEKDKTQSKTKEQRQQQQPHDEERHNPFSSSYAPFLQPDAPPPSAPPPPPPPPAGASPSTTNQPMSYQSTYPLQPVITNYSIQSRGYVVDHIGQSSDGFLESQGGDAAQLGSASTLRGSSFGDVSIRPNTGETNDFIGGIGSLSEVVIVLRWSTIATCATVVLWEGIALPQRILIHSWIYPAKVVLGIYLAVFALLLLGVEVKAPLRDNFGILYYPLGRGFLLFLMGGMCVGILTSWWEVLLGVACIVCGCGYVYAYIHYPEYRRWQHYRDNTVWKDVQYMFGNSIASSMTSSSSSDTMEWARTSSRLNETIADERQSLLV